jgi:hypothetical protein
VSDYSESVFINCPFDASFAPHFRAIVYALIRLGFIPRFAWTEGPRIVRIMELIRVCRFGIHDLSMQSLDTGTGLPRFNMPFELGLFMGCRHFSADAEQNSKDLLILDSVPDRIHKSLSDFVGFDIACHNSSPERAIQLVRDWLANSLEKRMYGAGKLQSEFRQFESQLPLMAEYLKSHPDQIDKTDICYLVREWIRGAFSEVPSAG